MFCLHIVIDKDLSVSSMDTFQPDADKHVIDGYDKLMNSMAKNLDIRLRHIVKHIYWNPNASPSNRVNVTVSTDKGLFVRIRFIPLWKHVTSKHGTNSYVFLMQQARYCLVTLPLGVLKDSRVGFTPSLPRNKLKAIQNIGFGIMDKVILKFERPLELWNQSTELIGFLEEGLGKWHGFKIFFFFQT
jgi:monoamine oxidase